MPATRFLALLFVALLALAVLAVPDSHRASAGAPGCSIVVNSTADDDVLDSVVTLREAIGFATDLYEPGLSERDEVSGCPGDDDDPGELRADSISFDETVFPIGENTTITLSNPLPDLKTNADSVFGAGRVTVDGEGVTQTCFAISSSFNTVSEMRITGCEFGVDIRMIAVPLGVGLSGPSSNLIENNVIVGNRTGVSIIAGSTNSISGNLIGVETDGLTPHGNQAGVNVQFGFSNFIGRGSLILSGQAQPAGATSQANVISSNTGNGIVVDSSTGEQIKGNIIGLGFDGTTPVGNGQNGVLVINSSGVEIGSTDPLDRNVISGNTSSGIYIREVPVAVGTARPAGGPAFSTLVQGNFIGTDQTGFMALGNGLDGVSIEGSSNNFIGGQETGAGNLISDNAAANVAILNETAQDNFVEGNTLGTDLDMLAPMDSDYGVLISGAPSNTIGGLVPEARNVIVGAERGVAIFSPGAEGNIVARNLIGELPNGSAMGNMWGVFIQNSGPNTIGGATGGNTIAHNELSGVSIMATPVVSSRKAILSNSIYDNGALGIDLEDDGVTLNDNKDPDTGANQHQNYPSLDMAAEESGHTTVHGTLNSTPNTGFTVQLFANNECDPSGFGEGKVYLGDVIIPTTDTDGNASFEMTLDVALGGQFITATATDPDGNTSEFSACQFVEGQFILRPWGDIDCMNGFTVIDGLGTLQFVADVVVAQADGCPPIGMPVSVDGMMRSWGDWNCNDEVDTADMIAALQGIVDLSDHSDDCPIIGTNVSVTAIGGDGP